MSARREARRQQAYRSNRSVGNSRQREYRQLRHPARHFSVLRKISARPRAQPARHGNRRLWRRCGFRRRRRRLEVFRRDGEGCIFERIQACRRVRVRRFDIRQKFAQAFFGLVVAFAHRARHIFRRLHLSSLDDVDPRTELAQSVVQVRQGCSDLGFFLRPALPARSVRAPTRAGAARATGRPDVFRVFRWQLSVPPVRAGCRRTRL